jgi:hypothetical protein
MEIGPVLMMVGYRVLALVATSSNNSTKTVTWRLTLVMQCEVVEV